MTTSPPPIVDWLADRSFGGREAVAVPGGGQAGPRGPFPAGVQDLLNYLRVTYAEGSEPEADQWAFLVGAPGNGKSESLRALAGMLGLRLQAVGPGEPAPREVSGEIGPALVRLVNDASIPRGDRPPEGSLHRDVMEAFEEAAARPVLLFANVNRGILVQEVGGSDRPGGAACLASQCLDWLAHAASGEGAGDPAIAYYSRREFETAARRVVVHVLSLDAASLFEPPPGDGECLDFSSGDEPDVAPYSPVGMLRAGPLLREGSVAATLIADVTSPDRWADADCSGCDAAGLCPFLANARWLAEPSLRSSFVETSRAAEVAAGRRITYRDLTGLLAKAILGDPAAWSGEHPCDWVGRLAADQSSSAIARLASNRIYAAMFPAPDPGGEFWRRRGSGRIAAGDLYGVVQERFGPAKAAERAGPFEKAFRTLDPAASAESWGGAREQVLEAVEAMHVEGSVDRLATLQVLPAAAACDLDRALDEAVELALAAGTGPPSRTQRDREPQVRRWRATLIFRHVGLATGWFCDHEAVQGWLTAQQAALSGGDLGELQAGLRRLLVPQSGALRLAPYRPRTQFLEGTLPPETLFATKQANELQAELRAVKDSLQFVLRVSSDVSGHEVPVPVDLDLAREAMLLGTMRSGFTDLPEQAVARVERVLASLLSRNRLGRSRVALQVSDRDGRLYSVRLAGTTLVLAPAPGRG